MSELNGKFHYSFRFHYVNELSDNCYKIFEKIDVKAMFAGWQDLEEAFYQLEEKDGYRHWQCHLIFTHKLDHPTDEARYELFIGDDKDRRINIYIKPAVNVAASIAYARKWQTRKLGPFYYNYDVQKDDEYTCIYCKDNGCILCRYMHTNAH